MKALLHKTVGIGIGIAALALTFGTGQALAGNFWATGHDADLHCAFGSQCNHFGIAIDFARLAAPDPTKPILFVTNNTGALSDLTTAAGQAVAKAANSIEGAGNAFNFVQVAATAAGFGSLALTTATYSAIVFASHTTCGGCDMTDEGVNAMNSRTADIEAFFNDGGGLVYFAGASRATSPPNYYGSVPIPATGVAVSSPFTLTAAGVDIGLVGGSGPSSDTNCCATHNSFVLPGAGSALSVLETDSKGFAETIIASDVSIGDGGFIPTDDGGTTPTDPIPEPASILLLGSGLVGLAAWRLRRRQ